MSTYDISGLDWQTENNFSILEPSFRESEGMVKVDDAFNRDDIRMVDAVFREGYLRGMNMILTAMEHTIPKSRSKDAYEKAYEKVMDFIKQHRDFLLGQNHINPGDDKALYSYTPFIDALSKKEAIDND